MWSRVELSWFHIDKKLLSAVTVTKGDGPDANQQTSTSTFLTSSFVAAPRKFDKSLREKTNVMSLIANMIVKDICSALFMMGRKNKLRYYIFRVV